MRTIQKHNITSLDQLKEFAYRGGDCTLRVFMKEIFEQAGFQPLIVQCVNPKGEPHVALVLKWACKQTTHWKDYADKCILFWNPGLHHYYGQSMYIAKGPVLRQSFSQVYAKKNMFLATLEGELLRVYRRPYVNSTGWETSMYH